MTMTTNREGSNGGNDGHETHRLPSGPVAVVLAGAGARGAYEAGFVATLLPHLRPRPKIFVGTSAGAINAALLASVAHRDAGEARDEIIKRWKSIKRDRVLAPIAPSIAGALIQYLGALFLGSSPPDGILGTAPLLASLGDKSLIDWRQIHDNIKEGSAEVLAVVATESGSGRSKVFYEKTPKKADPIATDEDQAIDYIPLPLTPDHVRASAAIPVLFPPVLLDYSSGQRFFIDGGVRLNAPLKPALQFGAEGVVVISTDPRRYGTSDAVDGERAPSVLDQLLQVMRGIFADRMIEDIRVLLARNAAVVDGRKDRPVTTPAENDKYIPLIFGGPNDQDRVGNVAARAVRQILRSPWRLFTNPDLCITDWLTSVSPTSAPDLLSYILFEPEFIKEALRAGVNDAEALLSDCPDPVSLWDSLRRKEHRKHVALRAREAHRSGGGALVANASS